MKKTPSTPPKHGVHVEQNVAAPLSSQRRLQTEIQHLQTEVAGLLAIEHKQTGKKIAEPPAKTPALTPAEQVRATAQARR